MIKIKCIVRWYDAWIGFFYDNKKKILYFFPIPFIGFMIWREKSYKTTIGGDSHEVIVYERRTNNV